MDLATAIVGLIFILITIVPFVIIYYVRVKKEKKLLHALKKGAHQHNCNISQYEFCGDYIMGIDESRNFVFFHKQKKEGALSQFVDLSEIKSCQEVKKIRNIKKVTGNLSIIEKLELSFTPKNKSMDETRFELYDEETNMQLRGELQFIDKWIKQINNRLKNKR